VEEEGRLVIGVKPLPCHQQTSSHTKNMTNLKLETREHSWRTTHFITATPKDPRNTDSSI